MIKRKSQYRKKRMPNRKSTIKKRSSKRVIRRKSKKRNVKRSKKNKRKQRGGDVCERHKEKACEGDIYVCEQEGPAEEGGYHYCRKHYNEKQKEENEALRCTKDAKEKEDSSCSIM